MLKTLVAAALIGVVSLGGPMDDYTRDQLCANQAYSSQHAEECADAVHPTDRFGD